MKHLARLLGFSAGYLGVVLLARVLDQLTAEEQAAAARAAELAELIDQLEQEAEAAAPLRRCLCTHCQAARSC